jgi:hypothetical protein
MDDIHFVPQNQKNIGELSKNLNYNKNRVIIIFFIIMFVLYVLMIMLVYWFFIIRETNKINQIIFDLDSKNSQYYPKNIDFEQALYNINDLITNSYNPISVIKSIESSYVLNSNVSNFSYNKLDKTINIAITVPTISDVTAQVQKFSSISGVSKVDFFSTNTPNNSSEVSFIVKIILK